MRPSLYPRGAGVLVSAAVLLGTLAFSQAFLNTFPSVKLVAVSTCMGLAGALLFLSGRRPSGPLVAPLAAFSACAFLGLLSGGYPDAFALSLLPLLLPATSALAVTALDPAARSRVAMVLIAAQLGCGLYGGLQYFGFDPFNWTLDYGRGRVFSTLGNPNFLAGQMVLAVPLGAATGTLAGGPLKWLGRSAFALCLAAMVFAQTRGAWLGLAAGGGGALIAAGMAAGWRITCAFASARRAAWAVIVAAVVLLPFSFARLNPTGISLPSQFASSSNLDQNSARQRFFWGRAAALLLSERPVLGFGLGGFQKEFPLAARLVFPQYADLPPAFADHPHNDWLFLGCELGLVGLGLLLWAAAVWVKCARLAIRQEDYGPEARALAWTSLWTAPGLAVHALWNMPSTILPTTLGAAVLAGLVCGRLREQPVGDSPPDGQGSGKSPRGPQEQSVRDSSTDDESLRRWAVVTVVGVTAAVALAIPFRPAVLLLAQSYLNGGRLADADGQYGPAAFLDKQVLRLTHAPWRAHFMLGRVYYGQHYWEEALKEFRADEAENPWGADAVLHQGKALRQMGRLMEAQSECRRALSLVPNYAEAAVTIASLAWFRASEVKRLGDPAGERIQLKRTRTWLEYALRFSPNHGEALRLLGHLEYRLGRRREALAAWEGYLRERPRDGMMREVIEALKVNPNARIRLLEGAPRGARERPDGDSPSGGSVGRESPR